MIDVRPLHPLFAAEVTGLDLTRPVPGAVMAAVIEAFEENSVLVFPGQQITDEQQMEFSRNFGPLEDTKVGTPGAGSNLVVLKNFNDAGEIEPPTARSQLNNRANGLWHSDSSFKPVPAKASLLSGRIVPSKGGNTEFISMRAVYSELPEAQRSAIAGRICVHDFSYGRNKIDPDLVTVAEYDELPPVRQIMVRESEHGQALYVGAHAARVEGLGETEGRALIDGLMAFATQEKFVYSHVWRSDDLVLWDNRAVMHRATVVPDRREKRLMIRTTVAGDGPTVDPPYAN